MKAEATKNEEVAEALHRHDARLMAVGDLGKSEQGAFRRKVGFVGMD